MEDLHWLAGRVPDRNVCACHCQDTLSATRSTLRAARMPRRDGGSHGAYVTLTRPARAVTPGQYAVFYRRRRMPRWRGDRAPLRRRRQSPIILFFPRRGHDGYFQSKNDARGRCQSVPILELEPRSNSTTSTVCRFLSRSSWKILLRFEDGVNVTHKRYRSAVEVGSERLSPTTRSPSRRPASSCKISRACLASSTWPPCARPSCVFGGDAARK